MKRVALVFVLFLFCCTTSTSPTSRAAIRGIVTDPGGAPLPGVTVVLHTPTGVLTGITGIDGRYEFAELAPEVFLALHAAHAHGKAGALELAFGELGVALDVFHHDDSEFLAHRPS